ncbi:MAG: hypothetical protein GY946_02615 [bacterium]|nr:hypothetical protein [bacterium]
MSEQQATEATPESIIEDRSYRGVLESLVGKRVTVVNPESFEALPSAGHELREGHYPGKISGFGEDYIIFQTVLAASKKDRKPVRQYIPLDRIKRVSLMATGALLHL